MLVVVINLIQRAIESLQAGAMARICKVFAALTLLSGSLAQVERCISLATSTTCAAFNGSSVSVDSFMVGLL